MNCTHCTLPLCIRAVCPGCSVADVHAALDRAFRSYGSALALYANEQDAKQHAEQQLAMLTKRYSRLLAAAKFVVDSEGDRLAFPDAMATLRKKVSRDIS